MDAMLDCFSGSSAVRWRPGPAGRRARGSIERAKIEHSIVDGAGTLTVGDKIDCAMQPYRGPDGSVTTLNNSIFSTVPGSPAYVAKADHQRVDVPSTATVGAGGQERHPVRLEDRLPRRMTSLPRPILAGIAPPGPRPSRPSWPAWRRWPITTRCSRASARRWCSPRAVAMLAWQVMIAAMMLPSSLPLVRLYSRATERAPQRRRSMAAFIGGYALVWSAFGLAAFGARRRPPRRREREPVAVRPRLVDRRLGAALGGRLPVHVPEGRLPRQVPPPRPVPDALLRARPGRRLPPGHAPRRVLRGLLLGADAGDVRRRRGKPDLDGPPDRGDDPREDPPHGRPRRAGHRRGPAGRRVDRADVLGVRASAA